MKITYNEPDDMIQIDGENAMSGDFVRGHFVINRIRQKFHIESFSEDELKKLVRDYCCEPHIRKLIDNL